MLDKPLEDGMCPWGSTAILFKHHRDHALIKLVEVIPVSLTIASALSLLFSEKFTGDWQVGSHRVDSHIKPEFGTRGLDDVQVSPMYGSDTARGRLSIFLGLTRHKHVLFNLHGESRLAGNKSKVVTNPIMSASVKALVAKSSMASQGVKEVVAALAPGGCAPTWFSCPWGGHAYSLLQTPPKDIVMQSVRPSAGQGVQPVTLPMMGLRPGRVVTWQIAQPCMSKRLGELSSTKPQSIDSRRVVTFSWLFRGFSVAFSWPSSV